MEDKPALVEERKFKGMVEIDIYKCNGSKPCIVRNSYGHLTSIIAKPI